MYAPANVGAQTLTIWARQNLQLLTPSQSGWRALVQMVLPLLHAVLKWDLLSDRPAYMGGVSAVLYRLVVPARPAKIFASCQMFAAANISTFFLGKIKNLTRLISVLSLPFKFVHNHKSCPNSAATLLSLQIEAALAFGRKPWKSHISAMGSAGLISATLLAQPVTRSSLGRNSCWPHSRVLVECLFLLLPPFLCVAWSCTVVDKNDHTIGAIHKVTFWETKNYPM